jgi:hypothetical protein
MTWLRPWFGKMTGFKRIIRLEPACFATGREAAQRFGGIAGEMDENFKTEFLLDLLPG